MTPEEAVLARVVTVLEDLAIPYMVTGSVASSYHQRVGLLHGRPRSTHDADVVDASGFYVSADGAREAVRERRQFNVVETSRAVKVDLIVRKARPFSIEEFARRQRVDLAFARGVAMVTPEDAILSKLEWARRSGDSERQIQDAAGIVELNPGIDRAYLDRWAHRLGLADLWERIAGARPQG